MEYKPRFFRFSETLLNEPSPVGDLVRDAYMDSRWDGTTATLMRLVKGTIAEDAFYELLDRYNNAIIRPLDRD